METFECGQEEDIHPHETFVRGADRYFAYAIAFFILDAFVWIIIAGAKSLRVYLPTGLFISLYIMSLLSALAYYIFRVREEL
jgi:NADH:ubiquinone oxidoreductase subunit 3 (subunit A)